MIRPAKAGALAATLAALALGVSAAQAAPATGDLHLSYHFAAANVEEPYRLYVPTTYDGSKPFPLVVVLHGSGSDQDEPFKDSDLRAIAQARGYIVVCPRGYAPFGGYGDFYPVMVTRAMFAQGDQLRKLATAGVLRYPPNVLPEHPAAPGDLAEMPAANLVDAAVGALSEKDVMNVLGLVRQNYRIDPSRIFLMGNSMGGVGTLFLGVRHPEIWAAIAPAGGPIAAWSYPYERLRDNHIAVMFIHADHDQFSNAEASRALFDDAKAQHVDASFFLVPDATHEQGWVKAVPQTFDFFDAHKKP